jgi:hypothetical protein
LEETHDEEDMATDNPAIPLSEDESGDSDDSNEVVERHLCYKDAIAEPSGQEKAWPATNARPGFDVVLQPGGQKAPKDISSAIDSSNIVSTKRRAHLAIIDEDYDFHVQCFHAGVQFFDQTAEAPKTFAKAMKDPQAESWKEAVNSELSAMERLGVWEVVDIPPGADLLNTVWVFRKKFDEKGNLSKFKARLCAAGNFQVEGIDYNETYAPTGRPTALRALLSKGIFEGLEIHQMDVRNAFLNGTLDETIYLRAPAGLNLQKGKCLHLLKSIYGLKQAPRVWHHELSEFFKSIEFECSPADPCLFVSRVPGWECWVHVYVDDMVIVSRDVSRFKNLINQRYLMEDLGPLKHLLGMKIEKVGSAMHLSQDLYIQKILATYGMQQAQSVNTPMVPNTRLVLATSQEREDFLKLGINYRRAVGLLNYLAVSTRPDILFAMSQLLQYLENPRTTHWAACTHLLRYLCHTPTMGLTLGSLLSPLAIYTDANHANDKENSRSYYGYLVMMGDSLISWKAKKYASVSSSTSEAEYVGLYKGGREAVWIRRLLTSLNIPPVGAITLKCDNQAAIRLSKNTVFADRTKHFRIHLHWIREKVSEGEVSPEYVLTHSNLADFLTKLLSRVKHANCAEGVNLTG